MQPDLPVRKPPGPLSGTGNGVIQMSIAPSSQGWRGAGWEVGENCKKPGREVKAGSSYLGQSDVRVHFGLGRASQIDRLEIRWPAGGTDVVRNVSVNQLLTIIEGQGLTERTPFVRR